MNKTFEESLQELEVVVRQLENGDLPLEESLKLFESGVKLSRECREQLASAEKRIEVLMKDADGRMVLQNLDEKSPRNAPPENMKRIVFDDGGE